MNYHDTQRKKKQRTLFVFWGLFLLVSGIFVLLPWGVEAAQPYQLLAPIPSGIGDGGSLTEVTPGGLGVYVRRIFVGGVAFAGVLAVLMLIIGGIEYMSPSVTLKEEGRSRMTNAIGGLLIALASYLILLTINPALVQTTFQLNTVQVRGNLPTTISPPKGAIELGAKPGSVLKDSPTGPVLTDPNAPPQRISPGFRRQTESSISIPTEKDGSCVAPYIPNGSGGCGLPSGFFDNASGAAP